MPWELREKVAIAGIGETEYVRWGQQTRSEFRLACEAILKALDDAGLTVKDLDGFASYSDDRNDPTSLATALGVPVLRFSNMMWGGGGGGGQGAVMNAMLAVATGAANCVVAYRSLCQGQFGRFGQGRPGVPRVGGAAAFTAPFGQMGAPSGFALQARRYMHEYGVTSRQFGNIAVAAYKHAQRNPRAVMYGRPITIEDHQNSRWIVEPLHLYDCCLENDGACAVVLVSAERARSLKHPPVYIMAAAQGGGFRQGAAAGNKTNYVSANFTEIARDLWSRAGVGPKDVDVAQFYVNFTPMAMMAMEDHGFCKRGEGGAFCEDGRIEWPDGELPINTSGGNLAEAYIHGLEYVVENVRQLRGTSTCQVEGAEIAFSAAGPGVNPVSDMVLRR